MTMCNCFGNPGILIDACLVLSSASTLPTAAVFPFFRSPQSRAGAFVARLADCPVMMAHGGIMAMDFSPLTKAVARLDERLVRFLADESDAQIRDGLIQRFEFTYDLAHKMLRRALEEASANPEEVDRLTFPTLIRTGVEQGLVTGEWADWRMFREMRSITSHTDDEGKALQVVAVIPAFLAEVQGLLARLEARA